MSTQVIAALIAAVVSLATTFLTKLWLDRRAHRDQLKDDYRHEQRKALQGLIGLYHGSLLDLATSWHYRMCNIYANAGEDWLSVGKPYRRRRYYFNSTVHRFLALQAKAQLFENEQIFIDARVVDAEDLDFVKFVKALHWVMSDVALFEGLDYDKNRGRDHFLSDRLRALCEGSLDDQGRVPSFRTFETELTAAPDDSSEHELESVFEFFDGLSANEDRFRWDRLVCLHLIVIAFVRAFGYDWSRPPKIDVTHAVSQIQHPRVALNLNRWLPRLGLDEHEECQDIKDALAEHKVEDTTDVVVDIPLTR